MTDSNQSSILKLNHVLSSAVSSPENMARVLFTYFLNTGVMDDRIANSVAVPTSNRNDHVGLAFLFEHRKGKIVYNEFITWVKSNELATFIADGM